MSVAHCVIAQLAPARSGHQHPPDEKPNCAPGYDGKRDRSAAAFTAKSENARDIGELPLIKDVERRDAPFLLSTNHLCFRTQRRCEEAQ